MELPIAYTEKMKRLLGAEFDDYLKSFSDGRYYGLRANTLKISPRELEQRLPFELSPIPWCSTGFYYNGGAPVKASVLQCGAVLYTGAVGHVNGCCFARGKGRQGA